MSLCLQYSNRQHVLSPVHTREQHTCNHKLTRGKCSIVLTNLSYMPQECIYGPTSTEHKVCMCVDEGRNSTGEEE